MNIQREAGYIACLSYGSLATQMLLIVF